MPSVSAKCECECVSMSVSVRVSMSMIYRVYGALLRKIYVSFTYHRGIFYQGMQSSRLGSSFKYNTGLFYTLYRALLH